MTTRRLDAFPPMMLGLTALGLTAMGLAACTGSEAPRSPDITGDCPAGGYQGFVGKPLAAVTYPSDLNVRIIEPGKMYTQEYIPTRMNIEVDADGTIVAVRCG